MKLTEKTEMELYELRKLLIDNPSEKNTERLKEVDEELLRRLDAEEEVVKDENQVAIEFEEEPAVEVPNQVVETPANASEPSKAETSTKTQAGGGSNPTSGGVIIRLPHKDRNSQGKVILGIEDKAERELALLLGQSMANANMKDIRTAIETFRYKTNSADSKEMMQLLMEKGDPQTITKSGVFLDFLAKYGQKYTPAFPVLFASKMYNLLPFMAADLVEFAYVYDNEKVLIKDENFKHTMYKNRRIRTYFDDIKSVEQIMEEIKETQELMEMGPNLLKKSISHFDDFIKCREIAEAMVPAIRNKQRKTYEDRGFVNAFI